MISPKYILFIVIIPFFFRESKRVGGTALGVLIVEALFSKPPAQRPGKD